MTRNLWSRWRWITVGIVAAMALVSASLGDDAQEQLRQLFRNTARELIGPAAPVARPAAPMVGTAGPSAPAAPPADALQVMEYRADTADGWKLVMRRYRRSSAGQRMPVILCHGFGYNAWFFDIQPNVSLARHLARAGFDVWVPDLRGSGKSQKWAGVVPNAADALAGRLIDRLNPQRIPPAGYVSLDPRFARWDFDDHVRYDVPAILHAVKHYSGATQVAWVGHSMGGNVMLGYLGRYGQDDSVAKLATFGSQVTMAEGQLMLQYMVELLRLKNFQLNGQNLSAEDAAVSVNNLFFNQANVEPSVVEFLLTAGKDVPSLALIEQYKQLSLTGRLMSADKSHDYSQGLARIQCPCLFIGGAVDQLAPPPMQQYLHRSVGGTRKLLLILGRQWGFSVNFGHNDSLVGPTAPREVFPRLANWLASP